MVIVSGSLEYMHIPVSSGYDTGTPPDIAITNGDPPEDDQWLTAEWVDGVARILIGPGGDAEVNTGTYQVYVRFTAGYERPILRSGPLLVT